jgi:hypothetical protein
MINTSACNTENYTIYMAMYILIWSDNYLSNSWVDFYQLKINEVQFLPPFNLEEFSYHSSVFQDKGKNDTASK